MSTANFYIKNAAGYYVVNEPDEFIDWSERHEHEHSDDRSYPGVVYAEQDERGPYMMHGYGRLDVRAQKIVRAGYYEAAVLDYDIILSGPFYGDMFLTSYDSIQDLATDAANDVIGYMMRYEGLNEGLAAIHGARLQRKIEAYLNELAERLDNEIKKEADDCLRCLGHFSNGSVIYARA